MTHGVLGRLWNVSMKYAWSSLVCLSTVFLDIDKEESLDGRTFTKSLKFIKIS